MPSLAARRVGLVLGGLLMGLFGLAFGLWFYLQSSRIEEVRTGLGERLRIATEAIERVEVQEDSTLRITLRDIALLDGAGEVIVSAPQALMSLDARTVTADGPMEFFDVELVQPVARLVQSPGGTWNIFDAMQLTAAGEPVETEEGRAIVFRNVTIDDGDVVIAMPAEAPAPDARFALDLPLTQIGGTTYQRYTISGLDAQMPLVRVGGDQGWRVEVASMSGLVVEPNIAIGQVAGVFQQAGEDRVAFDLETLRFGGSELAGVGEIDLTGDTPQYDLTLRVSTLRLADLQGLMPTLLDEGTASFVLDVQSIGAERVALDFTELDVDALNSQIGGSLSIAVGGETPLALLDAAIQLEPLDLAALDQLGLVEDFPLVGQVTGTVTSDGAAAGLASVNLTAVVRPADQPDVPTSTIFANGEVSVGEADEPMRLDGLTLSFQPLYLAALRGFAPEQADRLRGTLSGSITVGGTMQEVRLAGGDLSYEVGEAQATRFTDFEGTISTQPSLTYRITAFARPLALATVQELFPALPFREATLSGPITLSGTPENMEIQAELAGPSGGLEFGGTIAFGEPPVFDFQGSVDAFQAGMLLRPDVPVEGPLTGTFAFSGSMDQLAFSVDFQQVDGTFALAGRLISTGSTPQFDVGGEVANFRIGALLGEPELFPEPMTGSLQVAGGGGDPYIFDIDLSSELTRLDLSGVYEPDDIPVYNVEGFVAGLDLASLPFGPDLPTTSLTGNIDIEGRGLQLETLTGSYAFNFGNSTVAGLTLDEALGNLTITAGTAFVDTLQIRLDETFLAASGSWGIETPAAERLRYRFVSSDLSTLARVIAPGELVPPQIAGSISAEGEIGGSIEYPVIVTELQGRNLVYEDLRANDLTMTIDAVRDPVIGWNGDLAMVGNRLVLPMVESLETLRVEASGSESSLALGLFASRDPGSDLALSGILELDGLRPLGIGFETLTLRAEGMSWGLVNPARFRYVGDEGLLIENLNLQRQGAAEGYISINGMLPPTGNADLVITGRNVDLADLNRITALAPELGGTLNLDLVLEGPVGTPDLSITGSLENVAYEGVSTDSVTFDFDYTAGLLTGFAEAVTGGRQLFDAEMSLPMSLSFENRILPAFDFLENDPVAVQLRADSLPLAVIASMVPTLMDGTGLAQAQIDVAGTLDAPSLAGWARIVDGAVTVVPIDTRYTGINADIDLGQNRAVINSFTINNLGPLRATGSIGFPSGGPPQLDVNVTFEEFLVMDDPEFARMIASGNVLLSGPLSAAVVRGGVEIEESTFYVPELMQDEPELELAYAEIADLAGFPGGSPTVSAPLMGNLRVDGLEVSFGESVWLESDDMRVMISGDLVVYQNADELRVFGALQAERGTYTLAISGIVREFDVIRGRVQFFGTGDLNPSIDILAGYQVRGGNMRGGGDMTVLVNITGTMQNPRLQLSADTPVQLSEADLISYLLFGQPSFQLAGLNYAFAEQLLVQELVGGILAAEIERPIVQAGLCDWVRVSPGATTSFRGVLEGGAFSRAVFECGWELAPSLFLTAEAGIGGLFLGEVTEASIGVEWQINDEWMWEASYGAMQRDPIRRIFDPSIQTQFSTDISRQWEYGRPEQQEAIDLAPDVDTTPIEITPAPPPTPVQLGDRADDPTIEDPQ